MSEFSINAYRSLMNTKGKMLVLGDEKLFELMNLVVNFFMVVNTMLYQVIDLGLSIFLTNTLFEDNIGRVFSASQSLYNSLFSALGFTLFMVAIGIIFFIFMLQNPAEALKKLIILFVVIGLNGVIYVNGERYLTNINDLVDEVETVMVKAVTLPMVQTDKEDTLVSAGDQSSVETIREAYFNMAVRQPFAMVNFGTVEFKKDYKNYLFTDKDFKDKDKREQIAKYINKLVEENSADNYYLTPDSMWDKVVVGLYAIANNIFVGGTLLMLAIAKFLIKIILLFMVFLLPIISILSIIPQFSASLFSAIGKLMAVMFFGAFAMIGLFMVYFMMMIVDTSVMSLAGNLSNVSANGQVRIISCILSLVVKGTLLVLMVKNRDKIISFVTGGAVRHIDVPNVPKPMSNPMNESSTTEEISTKEISPDNQSVDLSGHDIPDSSFDRDILPNMR